MIDTAELRKARGAFFTSWTIADFLSRWAIAEDPRARVFDPSCGEAVFLAAAGQHLQRLGAASDLSDQLFGVDLHVGSLRNAEELLSVQGFGARLVADDVFNLSTPDQLEADLPEMNAVVGNPPFIRYQQHSGEARRRSRRAALAQGVNLTGLASSWAALLVHACGFLRPEGRLAMVLPAELLTVHYAEPVRRWLRRRFARVNLVLLERLQFSGAQEKVVLLLAQGSGGCDAFSLYHVDEADKLAQLAPFDQVAVTPAAAGKWTDLLLSIGQRQLFRRIAEQHYAALETYGSPELGTVTGANAFFALSEQTRLGYGLTEDQVVPISPPGTRHLKGLSFTRGNWRSLRDAGEAVWLLQPDAGDESEPLRRYVELGEERGVHLAYKCGVRSPWWRPPLVSTPDLFFTYMSHRYPRLVANQARVSFVNSMHGVRLRAGVPAIAREALPLLALNSVTMLGAEVFGRSYGGGILKMEPREAAALPVPGPEALEQAWALLRPERPRLDRQLRNGFWMPVVQRVDQVLLGRVLKISAPEARELYEGARSLRERRIGGEVTPTR